MLCSLKASLLIIHTGLRLETTRDYLLLLRDKNTILFHLPGWPKRSTTALVQKSAISPLHWLEAAGTKESKRNKCMLPTALKNKNDLICVWLSHGYLLEAGTGTGPWEGEVVLHYSG